MRFGVRSTASVPIVRSITTHGPALRLRCRSNVYPLNAASLESVIVTDSPRPIAALDDSTGTFTRPYIGWFVQW